MACKGFIQFLLKTLNFLLMLVSFAIIGYGIYMFITLSSASSDTPSSSPTASVEMYPASHNSLELQAQGETLKEVSMETAIVPRKLLADRRNLDGALRQPVGTNIFDHLPTFWFIYLFTAVGAIIFLITCCGCIAASTANGCCLSCYTFFISLFILVELAIVGYVYFDKNWEENIPTDSTGQMANIEAFIKSNIGILKWVALGAVILQAFVLFLSLVLRCMAPRTRSEYDSDDEYESRLAPLRQPLMNNRPTPTAGALPPASTPEPRVPRSDAWSTRMREKYGLDTSNFNYNPAEPRRLAPPAGNAPEDQSRRCTIM